jgi:hypothetical protein
MNRSQALAPLKAGEARLPCTVGVILRGQVRQAAVRLGVDFYEEKGWLESTFILRGPAGRVIMLKDLLQERLGED